MPPPDVLLNTGTYAALLEQLSPGPVSCDRRRPEEAGLFSPRYENQKTLARLARVCRTTSSPALALLWRSIDKLTPLLSLFKSYDNHERFFTGTITDADWMRFCEYSYCVRELHLGDLMDDIHVSVWTVLTQRCIRDPLLPRLERLANFPVSSMSACYAMLLSPTIRHLSLLVNSNTRGPAMSLGNGLVQPILAQLTSLSVAEWGNFGYSGMMLDGICLQELSHLQELRADQWVPQNEALGVLTRFSHLRVLHLKVSSSTFWDTELGLTDAFRTLQELELVGPLEGIDRFLRVAPPPTLEKASLVIEVNGRDDLGGEQMWHAILSQLPLSTLRAFRAAYKSLNDYDGPLDTAAVLGMLVPFSHLESLVLVSDQVTAYLYDRSLRSWQNAWPELAVFEVVVLERPASRRGYRSPRRRSPDGGHPYVIIVNPTPYYWGDPPPSITTLTTFAAAHPQLRQFTIPALDLAKIPDVASVPHLHHGLRILRITALVNDAPLLPFALALDILFPMLDLRAVDSRVVAPRGSAEQASQQLFAMLLAVQAGRVSTYLDHERSRSSGVADNATEAKTGDDLEDHGVGSTIRVSYQEWSHPAERWRTAEREGRYRSLSRRSSVSLPRRPRYNVSPPTAPQIIPYAGPPYPSGPRTHRSEESLRSVDSEGRAGREAPCPVGRDRAGRGRGAMKPVTEVGFKLKRLFRAVATPFMLRRFGGATSDKAPNR
ncbi:hypothetical protein GY45DRAFT_754487 [Cubamyces sp. BRFM 1775]|nr:hypothetical protein GY45DRAFT_754487 [Cubamyces sp. BRFM 1775]